MTNLRTRGGAAVPILVVSHRLACRALNAAVRKHVENFGRHDAFEIDQSPTEIVQLDALSLDAVAICLALSRSRASLLLCSTETKLSAHKLTSTTAPKGINVT